MLSQLCVRATHKNQCEDAVFVKETASSVFGVVCDGCSTGINSHFASQLLCYIVEKVKIDELRLTSTDVISDICWKFKWTKEVTQLSEMHLLTTGLFFHYDKKKEELSIRVFGDGYYYINGVEYCIDQNNTPDYLAYHLNNVDYLDYMFKNPEFIHENVKSFQICTDGIKSFQISQFESSDKNPSILLESPTSENYLKRMFNILTKNKWTIADDLSIISYTNVNQPESTN